MWPCYSQRTHYPMSENPGAQNITVCENQGKQCKLSNYRKYIKTLLFFLKKTGDDAKKDKD